MSGLLSTGQIYKAQADQLLQRSAETEQQRNEVNRQIKTQKTASTLSLAGTGAGIGASVGGPIGAGVGALVGLGAGLVINGT